MECWCEVAVWAQADAKKTTDTCAVLKLVFAGVMSTLESIIVLDDIVLSYQTEQKQCTVS